MEIYGRVHQEAFPGFTSSGGHSGYEQALGFRLCDSEQVNLSKSQFLIFITHRVGIDIKWDIHI